MINYSAMCADLLSEFAYHHGTEPKRWVMSVDFYRRLREEIANLPSEEEILDGEKAKLNGLPITLEYYMSGVYLDQSL